MPHKIPVSVLVIIHTPELEVLLLERAPWPDYWQSVTGSLDTEEEPLRDAALREVAEETGIDAARYPLVDWSIQNEYEIYAEWRWKYAPGVSRNTEHVFGLAVLKPMPVRLAPEEHSRYLWLPWRAAAEKCFSWTNRDAIRLLPEMTRRFPQGG
jgi:dATP pyrophosphohydrolase